MLQGEEQYSYVKAVEMAPFATENIEKQEVSPPPVRPLHDDTPDLLHSEMRVNQQLVQKYRIKLEEKRKQVGIITNPSSDLQAAENTLAEVSEGLLDITHDALYVVCCCRPWPCRKS